MTTRCVISGGGPAGLMAGFLLARAGVEVVVLEKHRDFLRDFRGDTIHPSTLRIMEALGLLDELLALPHYPFRHMEFSFGDRAVPVVDFTPLGERTGFVAMMPQWDFLDFVAQKAADYPGFTLLMRTESEALIEENGRVTGLRAKGPAGPVEIRADLVLVADGRDSALRDTAGLDVQDLGAPIDVLWFRVSRTSGENPESLGRLKDGSIVIQLNRGNYWQMAFIVPKNGAERVRAEGLAAFRRRVGAATGIEAARLEEIDDWDKVKLLSVQVNRLQRWWRDGLLCIGDAAHAMSPVGGVGINLAVQDAVAAANILAAPLRNGTLSVDHLQQVQKRRLWPARVTQRFQVFLQDRVIRPALDKPDAPPPLPLRILARVPYLRRFPARFIGLGLRPELPRAGEVAPGDAC
ncbi:FAD-dependent oxidoreductase [Rhodobacter sp. NTK016B]|uniref:FAD-dependent oxidoreductase n=1 Tax=Rhodobacter sp. NTK016B TaxID=2759676 RepID=UPI002570AAC4|nr:FAD-dependent oxidoreductase [Rhodobacter sp. NTK016B]